MELASENIKNPGNLPKAEKSPKRQVLLVPKGKPMTTKKALEFLLAGTLKHKVCRYCLTITFPLSELDQILHIASKTAIYDVTIRDVVSSVHPIKVNNDPNLPNKICNKCLNRAINSYLFTQQCEQSERALYNCLEDMFEKLEKLDPTERTKKRGRQKLNPNYNILYTEHINVIDYAEPVWQINNCGSDSHSNEPVMSDLECKKCWQVLPNVESLVNHEKSHPKSMWFNCRVCGQSFPKLNLFRKHCRSHERKAKIVVDTPPESNTFECKLCAYTSDNYLVHLQHIETHKFKTVMEHLVRNDIHRLCAVCLDKGPLTDIDKVISLHGGCPELTGERNLYSILGCTIPERNCPKYQELLIPGKMNVISVTKKVEPYQAPVNKSPLTTHGVQTTYFEISYPILISRENTVCDRLSHSFVFSKPQIRDMNTAIYSNSSCEEHFIKDDNKIDGLDDSMIILDTKESQTKNTVSEKQEVEETVATKIFNKRTSCKVCWIFNEPQCLQCVSNKTMISMSNILFSDTNKTKTTVQNSLINAECKNCWLFKSCNKCNSCGNSFVTKELDDDVYETSDSTLNNSRKRKSLFDEIEHKKPKWYCSVCLILNDTNRKKCMCCDSFILDSNTTMKVFSGITKTFLPTIHEIKAKAPLLNNEINDEKNTSTKLELKDDVGASSQEMVMRTKENNIVDFNDFQIQSEPMNNDPLVIESSNGTETMDIHDFPSQPEPMEIEENNNIHEEVKDNAQIHFTAGSYSENFETNPPSISLSKTATTFQFNIGSSDTKRNRLRRNRQPLRKTAFH